MTTIYTIYGEDRWLLRDGERLGGGEPRLPLQLNLADTVILTSGFALRDDDEWRRSIQVELCEYHHRDVASLPRDPIAEFLHLR